MRRGTAALCLALLSIAARADDLAQARDLLARGQAASALQRVEAALATRPGDAQARFLKGVVLMELGASAGALPTADDGGPAPPAGISATEADAQAFAVFTALSEQYPELPDPLNNIALLHARAGRLDAALQALDAALRNDPTHRAARLNLGQVHLMLAARAWTQASSQSPEDTALKTRLDAVRAIAAPASKAPGATGRAPAAGRAGGG